MVSLRTPSPAETPALPLTVSDALTKLLAQLGVREAYGVIGGAIAPFFDALGRSAIAVHHFRHEAGAAFAAIESYFASGRPAAVVCTSGPGLLNALTGMTAARWDGAKVVLISGATAPAQRGRWPAQETSAYTLPVSGLFTGGPIFHYGVAIEQGCELAQVGWRLAAGLARPGCFVAHLSLPIGLQASTITAAPGPQLVEFSAPGCPTADAQRIARLLASRKFALWVGFGARGASAQVRELARRTGCPVMCTPRAKGIFPESDPQFIGVSGMGGHARAEEVLAREKPDYLLVLGSRLAETASFWQASLVPPEGFIHVDVDPEVPGAAFQTAPTWVVQSEIGAFLDAVLTHLPPMAARTEALVPVEDAVVEPLAPAAGPVRPDFLLQEMQREVVDASDAVVLAESGNSFVWAIHALRFDEPGRFRVSSSFGSMGHACAGVVGAALARAGKAVALVGDGSLLMNNEISTAVQYGARAVWIVLNDARYGMVAQGMEAQGFTPVETSFPATDFVAVARAMGADGVRVTAEEEVAPALRQAMAASAPFVVDVVVDPRVPGPWMKRIQNLILQGARGRGPTARPA